MLLTQGWGQIAESSNYACTSHRFIFLELSLSDLDSMSLSLPLCLNNISTPSRNKSTLQKLQQAREFQWFCQSTGKVVSSSTIIYKRPHKSGQQRCWRENEVSRKAEPILPMRLLCPRWWRICPLTLRGSESCSMEAQFSSGRVKGWRTTGALYTGWCVPCIAER